MFGLRMRDRVSIVVRRGARTGCDKAGLANDQEATMGKGNLEDQEGVHGDAKSHASYAANCVIQYILPFHVYHFVG